MKSRTISNSSSLTFEMTRYLSNFIALLLLAKITVSFAFTCGFHHQSNRRVNGVQLSCLACYVHNQKDGVMNHERKSMFFIRKDDSGLSDDHDQPEEENTEDTSNDKVARKAMVSTIGFYKSYISPLLPPACRFTPTCSQYGIQAIEEYGAQKGVILIAWRLLRCSPIGGRGYDPPKWPPVSYTYSSY